MKVRYIVIFAVIALLFLVGRVSHAQAVGKGQTIYRACLSLGELANGLDNVVNEQQIYNNSRDIFRHRTGCFFRDPSEIVGVSFVGWYLTNTHSVHKEKFWVPIYQVRFQSGLTALRPDGIFRASQWKLEAGCESIWTEDSSAHRTVRIYGNRAHRGLSRCVKASWAGRKSKDYRESPRRGW